MTWSANWRVRYSPPPVLAPIGGLAGPHGFKAGELGDAVVDVDDVVADVEVEKGVGVLLADARGAGAEHAADAAAGFVAVEEFVVGDEIERGAGAAPGGFSRGDRGFRAPDETAVEDAFADVDALR